MLFSLFTHFFEVPLGAIGWLIWWFGPKKEPADLEHEPSGETEGKAHRVTRVRPSAPGASDLRT